MRCNSTVVTVMLVGFCNPVLCRSTGNRHNIGPNIGTTLVSWPLSRNSEKPAFITVQARKYCYDNRADRHVPFSAKEAAQKAFGTVLVLSPMYSMSVMKTAVSGFRNPAVP